MHLLVFPGEFRRIVLGAIQANYRPMFSFLAAYAVLKILYALSEVKEISKISDIRFWQTYLTPLPTSDIVRFWQTSLPTQKSDIISGRPLIDLKVIKVV